MPAVDSTGALRDVSLEVWAAHSELPYFEKVLTFFDFLKASLLSRCFSMFFWGPSFGKRKWTSMKLSMGKRQIWKYLPPQEGCKRPDCAGRCCRKILTLF